MSRIIIQTGRTKTEYAVPYPVIRAVEIMLNHANCEKNESDNEAFIVADTAYDKGVMEEQGRILRELNDIKRYEGVYIDIHEIIKAINGSRLGREAIIQDASSAAVFEEDSKKG